MNEQHHATETPQTLANDIQQIKRDLSCIRMELDWYDENRMVGAWGFFRRIGRHYHWRLEKTIVWMPRESLCGNRLER